MTNVLNWSAMILTLFCLIINSVKDVKERLTSTKLIYASIIIVILLRVVDFLNKELIIDMTEYFFKGILLMIAFHFLNKKTKTVMGGGDYDAVLMIYFSFDMTALAVSSFLGCAFGLVGGQITKLINKKSDNKIPFIPYLTAGYVVFLLLLSILKIS